MNWKGLIFNWRSAGLKLEGVRQWEIKVQRSYTSVRHTVTVSESSAVR